MRRLLKQLVHWWPWPLTLNEKYDRETRAVLKRVCKPDSICIDIGCFRGDILSSMIEAAPRGTHFAFEPVPAQFEFLKQHFGEKATIYPFALGNANQSTTFNLVKTNPTYSGLQQREYKGEEQIEKIAVELRRLDDLIPLTTPIHLIKIDVEGGELDVMKGAKAMLYKWHPYLIFEHGLGASDRYGTKPGDVYQLLTTELGYDLVLMEEFLKTTSTPALTEVQFEEQFDKKLNCYFLATYRK